MQVTLWFAALLGIVAAVLVIGINLIASIARPDVVAVVVPASGLTPVAATIVPGGPSPDIRAEPVTPITTLVRGVEGNTLERVRLISFGALAMIVVLGSIAAYWFAGRALRPVQRMSQVARNVGLKTLDTRLDHAAPDELGDMADAFNGMLDRLQHSFDQQHRFVGDAAHELLTPLAIMRTTIEVISSEPDVIVDDYLAMSATVEKGLARLERLVGDMLLLAEEDIHATRELFPLQPVVEEAIEDLRPMALERSVTVTLTCSDLSSIEGNRDAIAAVCRNLIENAIRYNRPDGSVSCNITRDLAATVLTVLDTGIGIPETDIPRIFDRFYRIDGSRSRQSGGHGLGLSIVAHIVQQHGGEVAVDSTFGAGSTFTIRLPAIPGTADSCWSP